MGDNIDGGLTALGIGVPALSNPSPPVVAVAGGDKLARGTAADVRLFNVIIFVALAFPLNSPSNSTSL
jgi:hypothetical protein